jgi:hypothetical protein
MLWVCHMGFMDVKTPTFLVRKKRFDAEAFGGQPTCVVG